MKTIFDFNPSENELNDLFSNSKMNKDTYLSEFDSHAYKWDLCLLFHIRNDYQNLNETLSKLDPLTRQDFYRTIEHT
ncbi:hypothetical protein [Tamlana sp. I1]|uniref:hypothetical protein n=1 Tax=Tamlana sp. I1 TaxID=2762061 RepID=UPI00188E4913|nr:hypothetical protein [Tamlana sp. I1]